MMILATLQIHGRDWFDFVTVTWVIAFFLVEAIFLFRNTLLGWAMTNKCLTLAVIFTWSLFGPVPLLLRIWLIFSLGLVIAILVWMRVHRLTVFVGKRGDESPDVLASIPIPD